MLRLWLPDRPGALGQVASRIGALQGEIVGIDILERGAGRAIDELAVVLPDTGWLELLVSEIQQVDGVDVEDVRPVVGVVHDAGLDALETAVTLVAAASEDDLVDALVDQARRVVGGEWAAVVALDPSVVVALRGDGPPDDWLRAFVEGSRSSPGLQAGDAGPDDVLWAPLEVTALVAVLGRSGSGFRARERRQVAALARVADLRLAEIRRLAACACSPALD